ncbi:transcriptional regulator [Mycobacterium sp. GA-1841]|uniref:transcriptional regulator n=1 Tax=Mycobacterium sp. GA-1841 TaxID=1834154 RepID=UPI00158C0047|nr:transcriptional regulator [Mycobacterium sp. GA-1841]
MSTSGPVSDAFSDRITRVLSEIHQRGYGVERLSGPLIRVFDALIALDDGKAPDAVSTRLAGAVADLTVVDVLPDDFTGKSAEGRIAVATISAPIRDFGGNVVMSVSAQPYRELDPKEVGDLGKQIVRFGQNATELITPPIT